MRLLSRLVVLAVASGAALGGQAAGVEQIIRQLSSRKFAEREEATRKLEAMGAEAVAPLKKALATGDLETRRRVERILPVVERRVEAARLMSPTKVRFICKDASVPDALRELTARSGFELRLDDEAVHLARRKITLDTGETTFWEALGRFCQRAGLSERSTLLALGTVEPEDEAAPLPLTLLDGRTKPLPTHLAGALRVRALPLSARLLRLEPKTLRTPGPGFLLEVSAEPKTPFRGVAQVKITRAVDASGRILAAAEAYPPPEDTTSEPKRPEVWDGLTGLPTQGPAPHVAPVRWRGEKELPSRLKEVSGVVTVQMQVTRPLIVVENILTAAGRQADGTRGGWVKVAQVERKGEALRIVAQVWAEQADPGMEAFGVRKARNKVLVMSGSAAKAADLVLVDQNGEPVRLTSSERTLHPRPVGSGLVAEFALEYRIAPGQAAPSRLVYVGPRLLPVEIPFVLRDVPLETEPQRGTAALINPYQP